MPRLLLATFALSLLVPLASACGDDDSGSATNPGSRRTGKDPEARVHVELNEFTVTPDKPSVPSGPTEFTALNASKSQVHELAVLRVKEDGSYENTGEVEDLDPGAQGSITLDLPPGNYVLACLIVPGEAGSATDHFQQGMRHDFEVK